MTEWDGGDLALLAPEVDERAAKQAFLAERARRRRTRRLVGSTGAAVALLLVVALIAAVVSGDDRTRVDTGPAEPRPSVWHDDGLLPESRSTTSIVSSGSTVFVFGGVSHSPGEKPPTGPGYPAGYKGYTGTPLVDGLAYDIAARRWSAIPPAPVPFLGFEAEVVWTGRELLVWGTDYERLGPSTSRSVGALFDPARGTWRPMASQDTVVLGSGVWTGSEFVVVGQPRGGFTVKATAYDPATDRWRPMADPPLRNAPSQHDGMLAWTGTSVLVTDGHGPVAFGDPATGAWRMAKPAPEPFSQRRYSTFGWTGSELLQLGGAIMLPGDDTVEDEGGGVVYDVGLDEWRTLTDPPPSQRVSMRVGDGVVFLGESPVRYDSSTRQTSAFPAPPGEITARTWDGSTLWAITVDNAGPDSYGTPRLVHYGP